MKNISLFEPNITNLEKKMVLSFIFGEKGSGNVRRGLDNVRECFSKKSEIWGLHNVRAEYEKPALNPPFRAFW